MARFLFVVVPLVARVWPAVAIGDALAAAGHDVAWCGPEGDLRPLVGPDATIYPTGKRSFRRPAHMGMAAVREMWDDYVMPLNRFIQRPVEQAVAEYQPDVVVADQYALAGALAAYAGGVPWATLASGVLELTPPAEPGLQEWIGAKLARAWEIAGLAADDRLDLRFSPYLLIATTTQGLTGISPMPEHWVLVGAALGSRRTDPSFAWDWWDPGRRHVLATAGTVSAHLMDEHLVRSFFARMMAALEPMTSRVQVVLNAPADSVPDPPPHVLVAPRVPMLDLMPRLDAVICQAGQSTVNEALANGVPLVVAPIRLAEPLTAEQVTRAGAGVAVSFSEATPAQFATAVTAVLDEPGYRANARRISEEYSAAGGTGAAAARLAALAARRSADDHLGRPPRLGLASDRPHYPSRRARMDGDVPRRPGPPEGPAAARARTAGVFAAEDVQNLRMFRATARAAGGTLDLVMPMRVAGDGPILFCAPPMVGLSWAYLAMLPHVDARFPLYGLQARGLRRPEPLPASMAEMARDYADQIRLTQPSGPYHLLGWSLGGNIAFAIAEELERRDEQVGLLVMLDARLTGLDEAESNEPWMIFNLILAQFGYVPALTADEADPEARMLQLVRQRPGSGLDEWPDQRLRALQRVIKNNVFLARSHQPGRVHCTMLYFSATRNPPTLARKLDDWRPFIDGPIEAVELDCDHRYMMLPEPVARLGPALSERLARAAAASTSPIV